MNYVIYTCRLISGPIVIKVFYTQFTSFILSLKKKSEDKTY